MRSVFGTKNQFQAHTPVKTFLATSPVAAGTLSQARPGLRASGGAPRSLLDVEPAHLPLLGFDAAGGGVHGMCGYHAARSVLRRIDRLPAAPLR